MNFPSYQSIDLGATKLKWGYYVPALIEQYRPDIQLIDIHLDLSKITDSYGNLAIAHKDVDYEWLPHTIEQALRSGQKIGLLVEDEHVAADPNRQLIDIVNHYQDQSVYWLTQHDQKRIGLIYQKSHGLQCKTLEFPWVILNECLMYDKVKPKILTKQKIIRPTKNAFFTLTGRYEPFRERLLEKLVEHDLHSHGLLTTLHAPHNPNLKDHVTINSDNIYGGRPIKSHAPMAAQFLEKNIWISCNTQNFLHMEQTYQHYPLAIIPETFYHDYFSTEKSVWPTLLGKLFLIFGSAGCMKYIQRFYNIDLSEFLNLDFDNMESFSDQTHDLKLDCMLESNKNFILNSNEIYNQNYQRIQSARNTIGPNLYQFVLDQVAQIQ
jgi:hypothetical protein